MTKKTDGRYREKEGDAAIGYLKYFTPEVYYRVPRLTS